MAHFAEIDNNNIVKRVIVADQTFINSGALGDATKWIQTSFNTELGKYKLGKDKEEQETKRLLGSTDDVKARTRKNFAGVGYTYDAVDDCFIPPQPFPSWKLDKTISSWVAPKVYPKDGANYVWDENTKAWIIDKP